MCSCYGSCLPTVIFCSIKSGLDDPETLDYEVTFRYFSDYTKSVDPVLASDATALESAYKRYKSDYERKGVVSFFDSQKDIEWFKERYHPGSEMTELREECKRKGREGKMQLFVEELEGGKLAGLIFDLGEWRPRFAECIGSFQNRLILCGS